MVVGGIGGSQKEDYLWEGEAGTEKNKFTVRILDKDKGQLLVSFLNNHFSRFHQLQYPLLTR